MKLSVLEKFAINYRRIFKLKGYCDKNYVKLNPTKTGRIIKKLRIENGYSQYTLADKLEISRQAVSKWERGVAIPSTETLIKLSEAFKVSINDLL